ncbi:MAG: arginyltransferase [Rhodospirillales bacterium]
MKHKSFSGTRYFFATTPMPCPYLPGQVERRVVTELIGRQAEYFHDNLTSAGFRRSHSIAYAPACPTCDACIAVRIDARRFAPSRSQRRIINVNRDLFAANRPPEATQEQYALFTRYQKARHGMGDMAKMNFTDYQALVEETPVETEICEFTDVRGSLMAACLTDCVHDGLSAVYSFFEPDLPSRSLGSYMILWLIEEAPARNLDYVYLGFWVDGCDKMSYKAKFQPLEAYSNGVWRPFFPAQEPDTPLENEVSQ